MPLGKPITREDLYSEFFINEREATEYIEIAFEDGFQPYLDNVDRKLYIDYLIQAEKRHFDNLSKMMRDEIKTWKESDLEGLDPAEKAYVKFIQEGPTNAKMISIDELRELLDSTDYNFTISRDNGLIKIRGKSFPDKVKDLLKDNGYDFNVLNSTSLIINEDYDSKPWEKLHRDYEKHLNIELNPETTSYRHGLYTIGDTIRRAKDLGFDYYYSIFAGDNDNGDLIDSDKEFEMAIGKAREWSEDTGRPVYIEFIIYENGEIVDFKRIWETEKGLMEGLSKNTNEDLNKEEFKPGEEVWVENGACAFGPYTIVQKLSKIDGVQALKKSGFYSRRDLQPHSSVRPYSHDYYEISRNRDGKKEIFVDYQIVKERTLPISKYNDVLESLNETQIPNKNYQFETDVEEISNIVNGWGMKRVQEIKLSDDKRYATFYFDNIYDLERAERQFDKHWIDIIGAVRDVDNTLERRLLLKVSTWQLIDHKDFTLNTTLYDEYEKHNSDNLKESKMGKITNFYKSKLNEAIPKAEEEIWMEGDSHIIYFKDKDGNVVKRIVLRNSDKDEAWEMFDIYEHVYDDIVSAEIIERTGDRWFINEPTNESLKEDYPDSVVDTLVDKYSIYYHPVEREKIKTEIINLTGNADVAQDVIDELDVNYDRLNLNEDFKDDYKSLQAYSSGKYVVYYGDDPRDLAETKPMSQTRAEAKAEKLRGIYSIVQVLEESLNEDIHQKDGYTIFNDVSYRWKNDTNSNLEYHDFISGLSDYLRDKVADEDFQYFMLIPHGLENHDLELQIEYQTPEILLGSNEYPFEDVYNGTVLDYIEDEDRKYFDSVNKSMKEELKKMEELLPKIARDWGFRKQR